MVFAYMADGGEKPLVFQWFLKGLQNAMGLYKIDKFLNNLMKFIDVLIGA